MLGAGLGIAILLLFTQLARLDQVTVHAVSVEGAKTLTTSVLVADVEQMLEGFYGGVLFPRRSAFFIPRSDIETYLLEKHPRLKTVSLDVVELSTLRVKVTERKPVAVWCESRESSDCVFVDENAFAYAPAPQFTGDTFFRFNGEFVEGGVATVGSSALDSSDFMTIYAFIEELEKLSLDPVSMTTEGEYFNVLLARGGEIRFVYTDDYTRQFENLRDVLAANVLQAETGERRLDVEYIDMRFGNKVYFKLLEEEGDTKVEVVE